MTYFRPLLAIAAVLGMSAGCVATQAKPIQNERDTLPGHLTQAGEAAGEATVGARSYQRYCSTCHGVRGDGMGPTAKQLEGPPPTDFTRGVFKFSSTARGTVPTDDDLVWTILRGVPSTTMPAWAGVLDGATARNLAQYIKTFSSKFSEGSLPPTPIVVPSAKPPATQASIQRGRNIFLLAQCWQCHGTKGRGNGPAASALKDEAGNRISPTDFTRAHLKHGSEPTDLYRVLIAGVNGTPMLPAALVMTREIGNQVEVMKHALPAEELLATKIFASDLMPSDLFFELHEAKQESLMAGWRWDLVDYLRSLRKAPGLLQSVLNLNASSPLYGGSLCDVVDRSSRAD